MNILEGRIRNILEEKQIAYVVTEHKPVYTNPEMAETLGIAPELTIKNLVLKTKEGNFALLLLPGNKRFDTKIVARTLGAKNVSLAKPEEVLRLVGCEIGCVPPFGHPRKMVIIVDRELLQKEFLYFNPGSHSKSFKIAARHLTGLCEPVILEEPSSDST